MKILSRALIFFFVFLPFLAKKENSLSVVINEIAWMGTKNSPSAEWIELYNNQPFKVSLYGWVLKNAKEKLKINLQGEIPAKGFYLLERQDDFSLPEISASQIYQGSLSNQGEILYLYDREGNLIDFVDSSAGWFAGDNQTKQTMERKNPSLPGNDSQNWANSQLIGGTPKRENQPQKEFFAKENSEIFNFPPQKSNNFSLFFEALFLAIFLAIFGLKLNLKLKRKTAKIF